METRFPFLFFFVSFSKSVILIIKKVKIMINYGYYHVAAATLPVRIGDVAFHTEEMIRIANECPAETDLLVFPELAVCGYTCGDLFFESLLLDACEDALEVLRQRLPENLMVIVGVPLRKHDRLYNCATVFFQKKIIAIQVKSYIPNYNEFYEKRWFSSSFELDEETIELNGETIPFSSRLLIHDKTTKAVIGIDVCEDLWVPVAPSSLHALNGANVIVNLSASNETIGKTAYRRALVQSQSAKCYCGYVYCSASQDESTSDLVFSGHRIIADNGSIISEARFQDNDAVLYGEIDLERCTQDRIRFNTAMKQPYPMQYTHIHVESMPKIKTELHLKRTITPYPFVPQNDTDRLQRCREIRSIQAAGLAQRLKKIHCDHLVIGISGGLDSTLALIIAKEAFEMNHYPSQNIVAVTMPGFGTTDRTHSNSTSLMDQLNVTSMDVAIHDAVYQHFKDISHDENVHDITYENSQARERTQILMDLANKENGIVLGTGDLSELALGWCTYNGDHMSMYAVNASIPKTLVRYIVEGYAAEQHEKGHTELAMTLNDICNTPVSPELLPPTTDGKIAQKTEESIGSYDLHDFFLYHMLRNHFSPSKIFVLAQHAFKDADPAIILKTMKTFYRRFFTQQFKRNCMPDGVKVGSVCLSPRGDWRMPSDASMNLWMNEVNHL